MPNVEVDPAVNDEVMVDRADWPDGTKFDNWRLNDEADWDEARKKTSTITVSESSDCVKFIDDAFAIIIIVIVEKYNETNQKCIHLLDALQIMPRFVIAVDETPFVL